MLVKKWIDNPNVDINWNDHGPMRHAVRFNQIEVVKTLLAHPKLRTDYENDRHKLHGSMRAANGDYITTVLNPVAIALILKNFTVLDLFTKEYHGESPRPSGRGDSL